MLHSGSRSSDANVAALHRSTGRTFDESGREISTSTAKSRVCASMRTEQRMNEETRLSVLGDDADFFGHDDSSV
jgi:hypothetical protein